MRHLALSLSVIFLLLASTHVVYSETQLPREKLLEETLMVRYLPVLSEVTEKLFMCERITNIKRLGGNRDHELTIEVVTFEEAHNPPHDLIRVTLTDTPGGIDILKVEREKNLSKEQLDTYCGD